MSRIQCIVSDMDGTLLPSGQYALEENVLHTAAQAIQKGLLMVAASGRPYMSLKGLWGPLQEQMVFICANGTLMLQNERVLYQNPLERKTALAIAQDIEQQADCEVLITSAQYCYIKPKTERYRHRMEELVRYPVQIVRDLQEIPEACLQVSAFREGGIDKVSADLAERWDQKVQAVVSGRSWMDFTALGVSKGSALRELMKQKGFSKEEVAAFGDSYNDISMFQEAGLAFAMQWSPAPVKQQASRVTADPVQEINQMLKESKEEVF